MPLHFPLVGLHDLCDHANPLTMDHHLSLGTHGSLNSYYFLAEQCRRKCVYGMIGHDANALLLVFTAKGVNPVLFSKDSLSLSLLSPTCHLCTVQILYVLESVSLYFTTWSPVLRRMWCKRCLTISPVEVAEDWAWVIACMLGGCVDMLDGPQAIWGV